MKKLASGTAAFAVSLLLVGCSSTTVEPTPTVTVTATVTSTPSPEPTPEPTEAEAAVETAIPQRGHPKNEKEAAFLKAVQNTEFTYTDENFKGSLVFGETICEMLDNGSGPVEIEETMLLLSGANYSRAEIMTFDEIAATTLCPKHASKY
ncbi:hypothetical protein GCM10010525_06410 [Glutamicibacter bergerei]|uniref:DUF732 domain-containing protein n=1 Tax=Glutamicibacter bergerei TaxID=256702 RepID=UPI0033710AD8